MEGEESKVLEPERLAQPSLPARQGQRSSSLDRDALEARRRRKYPAELRTIEEDSFYKETQPVVAGENYAPETITEREANIRIRGGHPAAEHACVEKTVFRMPGGNELAELRTVQQQRSNAQGRENSPYAPMRQDFYSVALFNHETERSDERFRKEPVVELCYKCVGT